MRGQWDTDNFSQYQLPNVFRYRGHLALMGSGRTADSASTGRLAQKLLSETNDWDSTDVPIIETITGGHLKNADH